MSHRITHARHIGSILIIGGVTLLVTLGIARYFSLSSNQSSLSTSDKESTTTSEKSSLQPLSLLFVGDIMLDRAIARHADTVGYPAVFDGMNDLYSSVTAVVANLEGPVTSKPSIAKTDYNQMKFTFPPSVADVLSQFNISLVSLANNHTLDKGTEGYFESVSLLTDGDITSFGSPLNGTNLSAKVTLQGNNICFIGYHDLFTHNPIPVIDEIKRQSSECPFIVVMPHWGEEYQSLPTDRQRELARSFIDAGADLIIGAHPHVIQPLEIYKNSPIFYSLGNHIFDQKLSWDTEHGLMVQLDLSATSTSYTLLGSELQNFEVNPAPDSELPAIIDRALGGSYLSAELQQSIRNTRTFVIPRQSFPQIY